MTRPTEALNVLYRIFRLPLGLLGGGCSIPFQDVSKCPLSGLLDLEQRQAAAGRLNAAVLQSQQQEKGPWLPDLLRQLVYVQVRGVIMLRLYRGDFREWILVLLLCLYMIGTLGLRAESYRNFKVFLRRINQLY